MQLHETLLGVLKRVHLTSADVAKFDLDVVRRKVTLLM